MRLPCPYCGGKILGIGWSSEKIVNGKEWCCVICRKCSARGPSCLTEAEAWAGWNTRSQVDEVKLATHIKLCRRNLKSDRVVCCATCPFEGFVVGADVSLAPLFEAKRRAVARRKAK